MNWEVIASGIVGLITLIGLYLKAQQSRDDATKAHVDEVKKVQGKPGAVTLPGEAEAQAEKELIERIKEGSDDARKPPVS